MNEFVKEYKYQIVKYLILFIIVIVGFISHSKFGKDNDIEQATESVIKQTTGIDIDFSAKDKCSDSNECNK